jgi:hypothetical protein
MQRLHGTLEDFELRNLAQKFMQYSCVLLKLGLNKNAITIKCTTLFRVAPLMDNNLNLHHSNRNRHPHGGYLRKG